MLPLILLQLNLYAWRGSQLVLTASVELHTMLLSVQTIGDYILVGDLIQGVSLVVYRSVEGMLELVSTEPVCNFVLGMRMRILDFAIDV